MTSNLQFAASLHDLVCMTVWAPLWRCGVPFEAPEDNGARPYACGGVFFPRLTSSPSCPLSISRFPLPTPSSSSSTLSPSPLSSLNLAGVTVILASVTAAQPAPTQHSTDSQPLSAATSAAASPPAAAAAAAAAAAGGKRGVLLLDNGQTVEFDECMWCTQVSGYHSNSVLHLVMQLIPVPSVCAPNAE